MDMLVFIAASFALIAVLTMIERVCNPVPTDWRINLQAWLLNTGIAAIFAHAWPRWQGPSLLDASAMPLWLALPVFFLVRDFLEWLYHFAQHRLPALWAFHSLHHSDPEMTALTTNRHFWGDQLVKSLTIWSVSSMVIAANATLIYVYAAVSLYNYVVHMNVRLDFGRWSWLLNSPAYHRRHHSRLPEHYDCNLAALFPIWDVIFRTYRRPDGWPPSGLDEGRPHSLTDLIAWPLQNRTAASAQPAVSEG